MENSWETPVIGGWGYRWNRKLDICKRNLVAWSKDRFKARRMEIASLTEKLGDLQMNWETNLVQIKDTSALVDRLEAQEELFWKQRSRIKWLQSGDSNTSFFHQSTIQRMRHNRLEKIRNANGQWMEDERGIRGTVDDHFRNLFTSNGSRDWGSLLDCVKTVVSREMNENLTMPIEDEEIKHAVFRWED